MILNYLKQRPNRVRICSTQLRFKIGLFTFIIYSPGSLNISKTPLGISNFILLKIGNLEVIIFQNILSLGVLQIKIIELFEVSV